MFSAISNSTRAWCSKQTHSEIFCFLIIILNIFWDNSNCSSLALVFSKFSWHCGCPVYRGMYVTLKKVPVPQSRVCWGQKSSLSAYLGLQANNFESSETQTHFFQCIQTNHEYSLPKIKLWAKKNLQYYMFVGHRYICFSCLLTQHTGCLYNGNSHASIQR